MIQKAVILARGLGTRMQKTSAGARLSGQARHLAHLGLKSLIPFGGRPFLDYIVGSLLAAGMRRICLVVAPDCDALRRHAARISAAAGVEVCCATQEKPLGTADAVLAAEEFAGGDSFILCNGDNLYPEEALQALSVPEGRSCLLAAFDRDTLVSQGNISRQKVRSFAVVVLDREGNFAEIVEKPPEPERYMRQGKLWVSMNLYRFTPDIFDACRSIRPHPERGELELTSAVEKLREDGTVPFQVVCCTGGVLDLTSSHDIEPLAKRLAGREPGFPGPQSDLL